MDDLSILGPEFYQDINLDGTGRVQTVHTFNVDIRASPASAIGAEDSGSNKVKITTITNQNWEVLEHRGRIVASNIHYLAYALKGTKGCVLRLIRRDNSFRALFKGFVGAVMDVAFCHSRSNLLACVDEGGNLYIWDLDKANTEATAQTDAMKITVQRESTPVAGEHRLVWSPHIQSDEEDEEDQDICYLVVTHANRVEVLDVHHIFSKYSSGSIVPKDQLSCNHFVVPDAHEGDILDLSLSPDGSVLATAGVDGHLKFWQVNLGTQLQEEPKRLHDFKPHKGAPVARLIFCDNHLCQDPNNQFWRFLITASPDNNEMKIWCTVNWKCLQTLRFLPAKDDLDPVSPSLVINMDLSASYLIVADSRRKAFLILQLITDLALGDASITSVTEYLLTQPILSFVVCGCAAIPERVDRDGYSEGDSAEEEEDEGEGEESAVTMRSGLFDARRNVAMIKLHCVHTRSMQELLVRFEPPDLFGVPPSKEYSKLNLPTQQQNSSCSEVLSNSSLLSTTASQQPEQSLSIEDTATPTTLDIATPPKSAFSNFPSTHSPKLLTPSDITSGMHDTTPLLSPADIRASVSSSSGTDLNATQDWPAFNPLDNSVTDTVASLSLDASNSATESNSVLDVGQSPAGQASGDTVGAVTPPSDSEDETKTKSSNDVSGAGGEGGDELFPSSNNPIVTSDPPQQDTAIEDEAEPSEEEAMQAFTNIFEVLQVKEQKLPETHELPTQTFQEFTELLLNPDKMQEEKRRVEDTIKALHVLVDDEDTLDNQESISMDIKGEDKKEREESKVEIEDVSLSGVTGTSVDKEDCGFKDSNSLETTETCLEDVSGIAMEITSRSGVESSVDLECSTGPKTPQDSPTTPLQEVAGEANTSERQEAAVIAEGMPEAHSVVGGESNETCGALTGAEENLTMPCALSDPVLSINQSCSESTNIKTSPTEPSLPESTPVEAPPTDAPPTDAPPTDAPPTDATPIKSVASAQTETRSTETPNTNGTVQSVLVENKNSESSNPTEITEATAVIVQTQETNKAGQKKKARRSKKSKKEVKVVDTAEVEDRLSDVEVSGSDSQLVLVEPPPLTLAQLTPPHAAVEVVTETGLPTSQQDVMLSQLSQVLAAQKELLEKMESEQHTTRVAMQVEVQRLREGLLEEQKAILTEFRREQQSRLDRIMKEKQSLDKSKQDKLISSISQTLTTAVQAKLDKLVKMEMRNTVVPAVTDSVTSVRAELSKNVSQCITQTNDTIRSRVTELTKSKEMSDAIGKAVSVHLQGALPAVLENIFKAVVLEPVERAFQGMFKQIDETFRKGTMEYLLQLQQQEQQLQNSLFHHVDSSLQSLHTSLASTHNTTPATAHIQDAVHQELAAFSQRMQEGVMEAVSQAVRKEVAAMADSTRASSDKKAKISQLLQSQKYNEAFELCLSTTNLHLVIFTCQQVDPDVLFDCSPIPLSQAVILSLIQQLSVDLMDNLEMKLKFLDPSVLALDVHNEVTKSHMVVVIKHLSKQLRIVLEKAPSSAISSVLLKQVKRLYQVTQHLCR